VALNALAGITSREEIAPSLAYLKSKIVQVHTPLSLSWSLLGLGAWDERPAETANRLDDCWQYQKRYGTYDTEAISLMLIALTKPEGILSLFRLQAA
jgi:hypothetical protein